MKLKNGKRLKKNLKKGFSGLKKGVGTTYKGFKSAYGKTKKAYTKSKPLRVKAVKRARIISRNVDDYFSENQRQMGEIADNYYSRTRPLRRNVIKKKPLVKKIKRKKKRNYGKTISKGGKRYALVRIIE